MLIGDCIRYSSQAWNAQSCQLDGAIFTSVVKVVDETGQVVNRRQHQRIVGCLLPSRSRKLRIDEREQAAYIAVFTEKKANIGSRSAAKLSDHGFEPV